MNFHAILESYREFRLSSRRVRAATGRSRLWQLVDLLRWRSRTGVGQSEYFAYQLWDHARPLVEREAFLSIRRWTPLDQRLNPKPWRYALQRKVIQYAMLEGLRIPTPELLGVWGRYAGFDQDGRPLGTLDQLERFLAGQDRPDGIVIKPDGGSGGVGVKVFRSLQGGRLVDLAGADWSIERLHRWLLDSGEAFEIIQARVPPHPAFAVFNPVVLGTIRVVTHLLEGGEARLGGAVFRLPIGTSGVDNFDSGRLGNLVVTLSADGRFGLAVGLSYAPPQTLHPDTGHRLAGFEVPYFREALDLALRGARFLPWGRSLGWDVGIGPHGPVVLEVNPHWGPLLMQAPQHRGIWDGEFRRLAEAAEQEPRPFF